MPTFVPWKSTMRASAIRLGAAVIVVISGLVSCSMFNREGPVVTCADLNNGQTNVCKDGIIAWCKDGKTVTYEVCTEEDGETSADDICGASWQVKGHYQCANPKADAGK